MKEGVGVRAGAACVTGDPKDAKASNGSDEDVEGFAGFEAVLGEVEAVPSKSKLPHGSDVAGCNADPAGAWSEFPRDGTLTAGELSSCVSSLACLVKSNATDDDLEGGKAVQPELPPNLALLSFASRSAMLIVAPLDEVLGDAPKRDAKASPPLALVGVVARAPLNPKLDGDVGLGALRPFEGGARLANGEAERDGRGEGVAEWVR